MKTKFAILVFALVSFFATAQTTDREMTDTEKITLASYAEFQAGYKQSIRATAVYLNSDASFATITTKAGAILWAQQHRVAAQVVLNPSIADDALTIANWILNASKGRTFDLPTAPADAATLFAEWVQEQAYAEYDRVYFNIKGQEVTYNVVY